MGIKFYYFIFFLFLLISPVLTQASEFEIVSNIYEVDFYSLAHSSLNDNIYFAGSDRSIFRKVGKDGDWKKVYTIKGERTTVNFIEIVDSKPTQIYVATGSGLFKSSDGGRTFNQIFREEDSKQSVVHQVRVKNSIVYIGTAEGMFVSDTKDINWQKIKSLPQNLEVYWIEFNNQNLEQSYLATSLGVYKTSDNFNSIKRIYSTQRIDVKEVDEEEILVEESEFVNFLPQVVKIDKTKPYIIYIGTTDGLFISNDSGNNCERKFQAGLGRASIRNIYQSIDRNILFMATDKGFFKVNVVKDTVEKIYKGLVTENIRYAISVDENEFLLATDKGLYETAGKKLPLDLAKKYKEYFEYEPTISEVREATIDYNDISSEKIRKWHEISKKKAWLPDLRVKAGGDRNETYEIYTSSTTDYWVYGPEYDKFNWDITLDWDLGDLLWSTSQTSIDVRSRLNTQLRIDILEEVNRLYFERYRLKLELLNAPPENREKRLEKELRLRELTSALDFYTGGFFTKRIQQLMMVEKD